MSKGTLLPGIAILRARASHGFHDVSALFYLPRDHMLAIQPLSLGSSGKELGTILFGPVYAMN